MNIKATIDGVEQEFEVLPRGQADKRTHHFIDGVIKACDKGHINSACPQPIRLIRPATRSAG